MLPFRANQIAGNSPRFRFIHRFGLVAVPALTLFLGAGLVAEQARAADEDLNGAWSPVTLWPLIPIHAVLLPDQRVLTYGSTELLDETIQSGSFQYDVWDITAGLSGGHLTLPNITATDLFCSSQLVLPGGGGVFIAGGDVWDASSTRVLNSANPNTNYFNFANNTLSRQSNMNRGRWYSTSTALPNGEVYIQGGSSGTDRPEVRQADGTFRLLSNADTSGLDFMYPRNWVAPDGLIFGYDSNGEMYKVNPAGTGTYTLLTTTLTGSKGNDSSAAMYRPGRILQFGGNSNQAQIIDITNITSPTTPVVVTSTGNLALKRVLVNATVLADGRVLATGGSGVWNSLTGATNYAEIWDPSTNVWTKHALGDRTRLYHSMALLLPDASVMVGGGGADSPTSSAPQNNKNIEIYYPPYLYGPGGGLAARPTITSVQSTLNIGETFPLDYGGSGPISRVALVKTGSVTHSWNMDQRFVEATFTVASGSRIMVQAPTKAADAPPGFYMLFALNPAGVPSVSRMVQIPVAATPNPAVTPTLTPPGNRAGPEGTPVSLQLQATDPNQDELGYGASGLPPGVTINPLSGLISGTPTTLGSYNVNVAASDGVNAANASFVWVITAVDPLVLEPLPAQLPRLSGSTATFTGLVSSAINPQYRWFFDDGTPETAWSSSPTIDHIFSAPGVYYVTLTVTDSRGQQQFSTTPVTVHFPLTANRPTASGNLAYGAPAGGNNRLWVVNQDNNSVTVFDAVTNARLAEIPVQLAPRSVAIAPDGSVWVTNKQSASISVIDPATLAVTATIPLPRGSQPYGLAFSAVGSTGYVVLEGLGKLLRLDADLREVTGEVAVGPNPRHVSVTGDGATVYVARFITPLLPGENTTIVEPGTAGGEVVQIDTAGLQVAQTITLRHLSVPDTATAGSGIPNYLGAPVISPDGTQAFVPSKQDNILRGVRRDGQGLNFQSTVRAITSRLVLGTGTEDLSRRMDHDNSSLTSAVAFDQLGVYAFAALETSREVVVAGAHNGLQILRLDVGRAPQGVLVSPDGLRLYVSNFMDRSVDVFDLSPLVLSATASVPHLATLQSVTTEALPADVFLGKQLFYDARDPRLALDRYMSCAACHNDGGQDGRVWDLSGFGEGLRNTISLNGHAAGQGFLHWSNNFDEVQDFEGQIRALSGGTGLMSDEDFNLGTRNTPLGDAKAGQSPDLDALAAYVASLNSFAPSPARNGDGTLTTLAEEGKTVFASLNCASCHGGVNFTVSGEGNVMDIGTLTLASGSRLGGVLAGIDVPTLRDVWATAPYLHDGSAPTLTAAIQRHSGSPVPAASLPKLVAYLEQIGGDENPAPVSDLDADGIVDALDNCTLVPNPDQLDANGDGYGNICDADINNSGSVTTADLGLLRAVLGQSASSSATAAAADMNGSGTVTTADFGLLRARLGTAPGPSGLVP